MYVACFHLGRHSIGPPTVQNPENDIITDVLTQVASKGLGLLTYVSQTQAGEDKPEGKDSHRQGPAAEASTYEEWNYGPSESRQPATPSSTGTWPTVDFQKSASPSDEVTKDSSDTSRSPGVSGSPGSGDGSGNVGREGGPPTPPAQGEGSH